MAKMQAHGVEKNNGGEKGTTLWMLFSLALSAAMFVTYIVSGRTTFTPALSTKVLYLSAGSMVLAALLMVFPVKMGKYALYLLDLLAWLEMLVYQASYISNVVVGIDGNLFSIGFLATVFCGLAAWITALIAAVRQKSEWISRRKAKNAEV